jgi:dTDP-4-amino-4,6-dideoxygalactose transaminase
MGFNFRYTDLHASLGLVQLGKVEERLKNLKKIYTIYRDGLQELDWIKLIPVHVEKGEGPLYVEIMVDERSKLMEYLASKNIQTRAIYPDLDSAKHLNCENNYPNARVFGKQGLVLPCGPDQPPENIDRVLRSLKTYN